MVDAYVLIRTDVGKSPSVVSEVNQIRAVVTAEVVAGPYDAVARVTAENVDSLAKLVVSKIQAVDGVTRTLTCPVVHL
ncbi:Lrp/AsnC ligand binding domain-containing protein [soil metagenome]